LAHFVFVLVTNGQRIQEDTRFFLIKEDRREFTWIFKNNKISIEYLVPDIDISTHF